MRNPWLDLDLRPSDNPHFVLPGDAAVVDAYMAKQRGPDFELATHLLPEPWVGRLDAPVVVLLANPGVAEREADPQWRPSAAEFHRAKTTLRAKKLAMPYYWLDEELAATDGYEWAEQLFKRLVADAGREAVGNNMLTLSSHPYHSSMFDDRLRALPSQRFTLAVLRRAIANDALIVALRARKYWFTVVPELEAHEARGRVIRSAAVQNSTLVPGNVERYDELIAALSGTRG